MDPQLLATIAAVVSAGGALASARAASNSAKSARRQAKSTAAEAQLAMANLAHDFKPAADIKVEKVSFSFVNHPGSTVVTASQAVEDNLEAEVEISGTICSKSDTDLIVTKQETRDSRRATRYPLQNQSALMIGGSSEIDIHWFTLPAGTQKQFKWIDRRSLINWAHIGLRRDSSGYFHDFPAPSRPSWLKRLLRSGDRGAIPIAPLNAGLSEFQLVFETRFSPRLSTVWTIEVMKPAITVHGRNSQNALEWKPTPPISGQIDDDIVRYRAHLDMAHALVDPPAQVLVPGRH